MGNLFGGRNDEFALKQDHKFRMNQKNQQYGDNEIKSTSSTFLTFVPSNLIHQFSNLPNMYFLLICILQVIPSVSVTGGRPTTLIPLSFVIITVLLKDAYEEFMRYKKDREENTRKAQILTANGFQEDNWENIHSGQVIKIMEDQLIPCDTLILASNLPDNKCFVQTRSLDGQTNLKVRKAPQSQVPFHKMRPEQLFTKQYQIQCEAPHDALNKAKGCINIEGQDVPFSMDSILLRGCHLRNCKQVIGVAIYVGSQTKVILNSAKFSAKKSRLMSFIDSMVVGIFIAQIVLSLVFSLFNILFENSYDKFITLVTATKFWINSASWWLLMTYFVPISLIVTMQMIKLLQGSIIQKDRRGFSSQYNCFISANNTSINQNLGQIKYVFTDKTGTLTKNQMNFKKIVVNGIKYGDHEDIPVDQMKRNYPKTKNVSFSDSSFLKNVKDQKIKEALRVLYLCHDIIINKQTSGGYSYNSSSPDQIALINFAKLSGYELMQQEGKFTKIFDKQTNSVQKYQKLAFLDFTSDRKRMSVISKLPNGQIQLLMKGADSIVEKRLKPGQPTLDITKQFLEEFSIQGLRTLMLAKRIIPQQQFSQWSAKYMKASAGIQDREKNLAALYQQIERDLQLVGGTAVEDKLQDQVEETIIMMKDAGIKFFILTGDKKQTAVSIGRSCGLISPQAKVFSFPQQQAQGLAYKFGDKVYLLDASQNISKYPTDIFEAQTICYRCTPIQKQNIVNFVKQHSTQLTLAIGDGANDVNMILAADVGVGVKGRQGTQATRVADIAVGQYKFLAFIVLYYGREWYRKNARLVCYNFFKNWYHVAAVITYGAYSYFSAVVIYDIYNYQLFNALYAAMPIVIYAIFDEQYDWEQSKIFPDIYKPGLMNQEFNTSVYFQNIGRGIIYGVFSIVLVFMVLEDNVLTAGGRTGYMWQSGAVLFFNIIMVCNFRIFVMSNSISIGLCIAVFGSIILYWLVYWLETLMFEDYKLRDSLHQQWSTLPIYFVHFILLFVLIAIQYAYLKYLKLKDREVRKVRFDLTKNMLNHVFGSQIFKPRNKNNPAGLPQNQATVSLPGLLAGLIPANPQRPQNLQSVQQPGQQLFSQPVSQPVQQPISQTAQRPVQQPVQQPAPQQRRLQFQQNEYYPSQPSQPQDQNQLKKTSHPGASKQYPSSQPQPHQPHQPQQPQQPYQPWLNPSNIK